MSEAMRGPGNEQLGAGNRGHEAHDDPQHVSCCQPGAGVGDVILARARDELLEFLDQLPVGVPPDGVLRWFRRSQHDGHRGHQGDEQDSAFRTGQPP